MATPQLETYDEKGQPAQQGRKGSIIMDEDRRRASVAAMTSNVTAECVVVLVVKVHG